MNTIFVASDGTGRTAEQALRSALTQFENVEVEIIRRPEVRSESKVRRVVEEAARSGGIIVHTLVSDELRETMVRVGRDSDVDTIDIMGPLLARLSNRFAVSPSEKPGLFEQLNKDYFRRIETMEFAIDHDDGMRAHELPKAEIVLLGVSRTFKTPLSIYLAFRGWFVANVPIVMGLKLPSIVYRIQPAKVFCLSTDPRPLAELRRARQEFLGVDLGEYADFDYVRRELKYANEIFRKHPKWSVVDVTGKPIEEIVSEILSIKGRPHAGF